MKQKNIQNPGIVIMVLIVISIIAGVFGITAVKLEKGITGMAVGDVRRIQKIPIFR